MRVGPAIRRLFGPFERNVADFYRRLFFDIDDFVREIGRLCVPRRILEIGCGEGALCERLASRFPAAEILGIDISNRVGRLAKDSNPRLRFQRATAPEIARFMPAHHDLVILCDVLHHVPPVLRDGILRDALATLAPGGTLVVKEWARNLTAIHGLAYASDRLLTGDRVEYETAFQWASRLRETASADTSIQQRSLRPWRNNVAFFLVPPVIGAAASDPSVAGFTR